MAQGFNFLYVWAAVVAVIVVYISVAFLTRHHPRYIPRSMQDEDELKHIPNATIITDGALSIHENRQFVAGDYTFQLLTGGTLTVQHKDGTIVWTVAAADVQEPASLLVNTKGYFLALTDASGRVLWSIPTIDTPHPAVESATLSLRQDGVLQLSDRNGSILWQS